MLTAGRRPRRARRLQRADGPRRTDKKKEPRPPVCTALSRGGKPANAAGPHPRQPEPTLGEEAPRRFLTVLAGDDRRRSRRAAAGSNWPQADRQPGQPADGPRASSTASGSTTSAGASSARRATSARSASGRRTPSCSTTWPAGSSSGLVDQGAAPRDRAVGDVPAEHAGRRAQRRASTRTIACCGG